MGVKDDLTSEVKSILDWKFEVSQSRKVPTKDDLTLGKTARRFETAVLYTDVRGSSRYPEEHRRATAAKIFNAFLNGAVRIMRRKDGEVRSFNGDSILTFFDPSLANPADNAVEAAMNLSYFVKEILRPQISSKKYEEHFDVGIGVAYGEVFATKVGIGGTDNNDIIWPATATNLAAKLGDAGKSPVNIRISEDVYKRLSDKCLTGVKDDRKVTMWTKEEKFPFAGDYITVYATNWHWKLP